MKLLNKLKEVFRPELFIVHDNVIDMHRYKLKKFRQTEAHKYGLQPEAFVLYLRLDGTKEIVASLNGKPYHVTRGGLQARKK